MANGLDLEMILLEFLNSPFNKQFDDKLRCALKDMGLKYVPDPDGRTKGQIVSIEPATKEEQEPKQKPCDTCNMATNNCALTCKKYHDYMNSCKPEQDYQWNGKVSKKEPTGVLKETLDNMDEKELAETKEKMTKDGELTEFEKCLKSGTNIYVEQGRHMEDWDAREDAKELIAIARQQVIRETMEKKVVNDYICQVKDAKLFVPDHSPFVLSVLTAIEKNLIKLRELIIE